jgi:hypothetical protein
MSESPTAPTPADTSSGITVVCCIEAGNLEGQTLRMLRSLRRWGGRLARSPVLAVAPRRNAPLSSRTLSELRALDVEFIRDYSRNPLPWFNYANKTAASLVAERHATTPVVLWLDSDIIVAGEPTSCFLAEDVDFAARGEPLAPATREPGDPFETYWRAVCTLLGIDFDSLPYLELEPPERPIRLHVNGGVYAWRRGKGMIEALRDHLLRLTRSRLAPPNGLIHLNEQLCLGLTVHRLGLRFRHLDRRDNHMIFPGLLRGVSEAPPLTDANIIHYSQSDRDPHRPIFLDRLLDERPEVFDWLAAEGPVDARLTPLQRTVYLPYKIVRNAQYRFHTWRAIPVVGAGASP